MKKFIILLFFSLYTTQIHSQNVTVRIVENPVGIYTANLDFEPDPNKVNVQMELTRFTIYVNGAQSLNITDNPDNVFEFVEVRRLTAADQNNFCSDIAGETRDIVEIRDADPRILGDLRSGGTIELFSFEAEKNIVSFYQRGSSPCLDGETSITASNIDPDGPSNLEFGPQGEPLLESLLLPVEFSYFNATKKDQNSFLSWETSSEINNDFFDIERSGDGRVFEKIGKVKGNGTTTETQNYEFIDREPFPGLNYYRLKQVDYNGDYEYSKVATVDFRTGTEGDVAIFPNPAVDYVNISLDRSYDGIRVTNSLGQLVEVLPAQLYESNQFRLDLTGYTPGVYFLEAKLGLEIVNKQFVKIK